MVPGDLGIIETMVSSTYQERLNEAMADACVSTTALATALGVTYQAVKKVREGKSRALTSENNSAAAKFLGVSGDWLATGAGSKRVVGDIVVTQAPDGASMTVAAQAGAVQIQQLDVVGSMGTGAIVPTHEDVVAVLQVREEALRAQLGNTPVTSFQNLRLISAHGDSMRPTFDGGDVLLVDTGVSDVKIDAVYVMSHRQELFIKRLQRRPDGVLRMLSDNKNYDPVDIVNGERDQFQVLGRVLMTWNARKL